MKQQNATPRHPISVSASSAPRHNRRWVWAAAMIGAMSIASLSYAGGGYGDHGWQGHHHRMGPHGQLDPATAAQRAERMIGRLVPDATPEQKSKISAIAKAAMTDLQPLREKRRAARAETMKLLSQPTVDRAALEKIRASEMQLADQMSQRMTRMLADTAEVLTPQQRAKAAEHFGKRKGHIG